MVVVKIRVFKIIMEAQALLLHPTSAPEQMWGEAGELELP